MQTDRKLLATALFGVFVLALGYVLSQHPRIACNREYVALTLSRHGRHSSWQVHFCDGFDAAGRPFFLTVYPAPRYIEQESGYRLRFYHLDWNSVPSSQRPEVVFEPLPGPKR